MSELISAIFGIFLGAYGSHLLSKDSARTVRIRTARAKIRGWIDLIASTHPGYLYQSHESICAEIGPLRNTLIDDLRFWQRNRFTKACQVYLTSSDEECRPVVTPGPSTGSRTNEDQQREKENWLKPGRLLVSRLEAILKYT